jgi:hypothetical protein
MAEDKEEKIEKESEGTYFYFFFFLLLWLNLLFFMWEPEWKKRNKKCGSLAAKFLLLLSFLFFKTGHC